MKAISGPFLTGWMLLVEVSPGVILTWSQKKPCPSSLMILGDDLSQMEGEIVEPGEWGNEERALAQNCTSCCSPGENSCGFSSSGLHFQSLQWLKALESRVPSRFPGFANCSLSPQHLQVWGCWWLFNESLNNSQLSEQKKKKPTQEKGEINTIFSTQLLSQECSGM